MWRTLFAAICTFDTKSTKSGADCDAAPHAKMYAARYPSQRGAKAATATNTTVCFQQPTFDASRLFVFGSSTPEPLEITNIKQFWAGVDNI